MRRFLIGEVCDTLGVKPHVLRYWEQQIGLLSPAKNHAGRRVYSMADLQTLSRVKYLVHERRFTLEGAGQKILEEASGEAADAKASVQQLRERLIENLDGVRRLGEALDRFDPPPDAPQENASVVTGWPRLTPAQRERLRTALARWQYASRVRERIRTGQSGMQAAGSGEREPPVRLRMEREPQVGQGALRAISRLIREDRLRVVTMIPSAVFARGGHAVAQRLAGVAEGLRALSYGTGGVPQWKITVPLERRPQTLRMLEEANYYHLRADRTGVEGLPEVPIGAEEGRIHLTPERELAGYQSPLLALLHAEFWKSAGGQVAVVTPLAAPIFARPEEAPERLAALLRVHLTGKADVTIRCAVPNGGTASGRVRLRSTGELALTAKRVERIRERVALRSHEETRNILIPGDETDEIRDMEVRRFRVRMRDILEAADRPCAMTVAEPLHEEADQQAARGTR
jgi:DNA-binding transcriptional MerR regulator